MLKIYSSLTVQHDYRLMLLAAAFCLVASGMTIDLLHRFRRATGRRYLVGLFIASGVSGIGVWATHFIAMLAFRPGVAVGYDLGLTLASLAAAIALIAAGFQVGLSSSRAAPAAGGLLVGLAVCVMHILGMAAFQVEGHIAWDPALIAWAGGVGLTLSTLSLILGLRPGVTFGGRVGAAAVLACGILVLHFLGMAAMTISPDPSVHVASSTLGSHWLALWIAGAGSALLMLTASARGIEFYARREEARRRNDLANTAVEGLVVCDGGRVTTANGAFCALTGFAEAELMGRNFAELFEDDWVAERLATGAVERFETLIRPAEGEPFAVELIVRMLSYDGCLHQGVAIRDLRARQEADARIRFLAHHDPLTGLFNRASFNERLERELGRQRRKDDAFAVLCLDLDRFKMINDTFGHPAGDAVLKAVSRRVGEVIDAEDIFARLGGDEFAIIRHTRSRPGELAAVSDRILQVLSQPIDVGGPTVLVGVSVGIALFPADGHDAKSLLSNADAALYQAKSDGRGTYRFFEPAIGAELRDRQGMEYDLRHAGARGEFTLVYQPQICLATGETFGFEALLRWTHPQRGEVPPCEFIPVAEESGLILPIGEWVLRQACAEAASWSRPLKIAVNLSGVQLHAPSLPDLIDRVLRETGLAPGRLELEITETALIQDFDRALGVLRQIKALGVQISMDDFGTGYASLSNLRAFPFDKIKIDQSFIRNVHSNSQAATIVRAIFGLARGLDLVVLAEGVETQEELAFLGGEFCAEAQGYLFGRPAEIAAFGAAFAPAAAESLARRTPVKRLA